MWILNVKFILPHGIFLSLVILSAIFNVNVLGFSMYFCLKNNKDLLFIYLWKEVLLFSYHFFIINNSEISYLRAERQ